MRQISSLTYHPVLNTHRHTQHTHLFYGLWTDICSLISRKSLLFFFLLGESKNTVPITTNFAVHFSTFGKITGVSTSRGQWVRLALGKNTFLIMVSRLPGKYHRSLFMLYSLVHAFTQTVYSGISFPLVLLDDDYSVFIFEKFF